jgi:SSS family solute:Na+ symporter
MQTALTFIAFTAFVALYSWYRLRKESLSSQEGYFLGGRSLSGWVIAGSMILTNISTEHLIGMNGSSYRNGFVIIGWEVTSALALVVAALFFVPKYLKMGLTTIPEFLEYRFDATTRTLVASFLMISFVVTLLPIVLYTGALNLESIFSISERLGVDNQTGLWITVFGIGTIGSIYAIFGGLKAVAFSDSINGIGLLIGGTAIPLIALYQIGDGHIMKGLSEVFMHQPEKFNVIGSKDSVLPFEVLFTGLMINQLYFWGMNQTIIQRALGAKNLKEAQKGLLYTGVLKIMVPIIIILPGVIGYYYFGDALYENQDMIYPELIKKLLPSSFVGLFAAIVMGAVLSTFNSVLNSAATIFSLDIYKKHLNATANDQKLVQIGKITSTLLALFAMLVAPLVVNAPEGLYQLLQQLNGIFFIPIASIMLAGFFMKSVTAIAAKVALIFGLVFYITTTFIFQVDLHFVHLWGIEFALNIALMYIISSLGRSDLNQPLPVSAILSDLQPWKHTKVMSIILCAVTVIIYILLGQF